jgi:hypothetical protein
MNITSLLRLSFVAGICVAMNFDTTVGQVRVLPPDEVAARVPLFTEVNFENVNLRNGQRNVRTGGVLVRRSALERCNECPLDPGDTNAGNIQLVLNPRGPAPNVTSNAVPENAVRFVFLPRFVVWEIAGESTEPFTFRITDGEGRRWLVEGSSAEGPLGIESAYGLRQVEVASGEGAGAVKFPRLFLHNVPPPVSFIARPLWSTQVNLTWRYPDLEQDGFRLERSEGTRSNFVEIANLPPEARSFEDIVASGSRYFYRVRANHPSGESAYSLDATARTGGRETNVVFRAIGAEDGTVCENSAFMNRGEATFRSRTGGDAVVAGDLRGNQQCKGILSFNTISIPDGAEILSATLQLTQGSSEGNAFEALGPLHLDMSSADGFGGSPGLNAGDFEAGVAGARVARIGGSSGNLHRVVLDRRARSFINKAGRTQFRLYFGQTDNNNFSPDNIGFFSGESPQPGTRPVLEILYRRR